MSGVLSGRVGHCAEDPEVPGHSRAPGGPVIKERRKARLWRLRATGDRAGRWCSAPPTSGCSMSYKLDSFLGKDAEKAEHTARSARRRRRPRHQPCRPRWTSPMPKPRRAVLAGQPDKNASQPWENPAHRGARDGHAIADAYTRTVSSAATSSRAMSATVRSPGCRAMPAASTRASGPSARCAR